mmetsp:Transcript_28117/g.97311  ORF Transcript_28117/g.97311 Transcript_28117/m.97311 type:complete len:247 (-) Transcript_28117:476-1216(-)
MMPSLLNCTPIAWLAPASASYGTDSAGKRYPICTYGCPNSCSCVDVMLTAPLGARNMFTLGLPSTSSCAASMTPPSRQKPRMKAFQLGYSSGWQMTARRASFFRSAVMRISRTRRWLSMSLHEPDGRVSFSRRSVCTTLSVPASRYACPRPPNSSSILNSQRWPPMLAAISLASAATNSSCSKMSCAPGAMFTFAIANTRLEPLLVEYSDATAGSGASSGTSRCIDSRLSSGPTVPGTMYASLPLQ